MLPKNLKYGSRIESQMARATKNNISPQNGTGPYGLGDTIIINVPTRNNLVLSTTESYLKFNLQVTNTSGNPASFRFDSCGAHGIISRIRIFHGSNLLQDISEYGLLSKFLFDMQVSYDGTIGKYSVLAGTRADQALTLPTSAPPANAGSSTAQIDTSINTALAPLSNAKVSFNTVNSGEFLGTVNNNASTTSRTYCLNLISLIGTLCSSQYLPLFAMTSSPLRVEIQLVDAIQKAICCNGTATIAVSNVEYIGSFIELSDEAVGMIYSSLQGQSLQLCVPDYRNYQYNQQLTNGTASQINFSIPAKFSSLKSIYATCRDQGTGAFSYFPFSSVNKGLVDYYFRVGATIMPTKSPNTLPEMFSELLKSVGSMSDLNHHPAIDFPTYSILDSLQNGHTTSTVSSASWYLGIDLESYSNSDKSQIFQGYNSNTDDIFLVLNYSGAGSTSNCRYDAFALFDSVVVFENNTAYCKF